MVEQVDRELLFVLANVPKEQAVGLYEGNFDHDPMVKRKLDAVKAFRIAAEARGMEAAARIAESIELLGAEQNMGSVLIRRIIDAIRASIGKEHSSEVERLREALEWIANFCKEEAKLEYNDAMRKVFQKGVESRARAALNGGQHE